jgi:hypothetical protein
MITYNSHLTPDPSPLTPDPSPLTSYGISSTVEQVRKNKLFMQNKAKFRKVKLNVNRVLTRDYDQMDTWSIRITKPIKAN